MYSVILMATMNIIQGTVCYYRTGSVINTLCNLLIFRVQEKGRVEARG